MTFTVQGLAVVAESPASDIWLQEDLGEVSGCAKVTKRCLIKNDTDDGIVFSASRTSCGCLSIVRMPTLIEAHGEGHVLLQLDARRLHGSQTQRATVTVKHPSINELHLAVRALVSGVWAEPASIDLGTIVSGKPQAISRGFYVLSAGYPETRVESITVAGDGPPIRVDVRGASSNATAMDARIVALKHASLEWPGCGTAPGRVRARVVVTTNNPSYRRIEVPVTAHVVGDLPIRPSRLVFGLVGREATAKRSCVLDLGRARQAFDPAALEVISEHAAVRCRHAVARGGRELRIEIECEPRLLACEPHDGLLKGAVTGRCGGKTVFSIPYVAVIERVGDGVSDVFADHATNSEE